MKSFIRLFLFPFITGGGACTVSEECPALPFPTIDAECDCDFAVGGINEYYIVPCSSEFTEENVTSPQWYTDLIEAGNLGRSGIILGGITKLGDKKERVGSCRTEQTISATWGFKFTKKCFDKTVARKTVKQMNALIKNANRFLVILRMCDGDETILPVGIFTTNDFNWVVPDNFEELQSVEATLAWKELGIPETVDVPGLNAVVPKLS